MKLKFYSGAFQMLFAVLLMVCSTTASAQKGWEQIYQLPTTNAMHISSEGNLILADYTFDGSGGIYLSTDKGENWKKTNAPDYAFNLFVENDEYIFAAGMGCKVARSDDGGQTWEMLSYARNVEDLIGAENVDWSNAYAMTFHDGKLFVGDFCGGGVVYSEDNGETWVNTDVESLSFGEPDPKLGKRMVENIYNLVSYQGHLYAFGVYFVFRYDATTNAWEVVRDDSNFMAVSAFYKGMACFGRSVMNDSYDTDFIVTLNEAGEWGALPRPETYDNNIRAMYAEGDYLFAGMAMTGFYYTNDSGQTWNKLEKNYPGACTPMAIRTDENYVYLACYYTPWGDAMNDSGLWRIAKSELEGGAGGGEEEALKVVATNPDKAVSSLETIVLTFNAEVAGQFDPYSMTAMKVKKDGAVACGVTNYMSEGTDVIIALEKALTEEGEYTLVIPEGLITRASDGAVYAGEHTFTVSTYAPYFNGEKTNTGRNITAVSLNSPAMGVSTYTLADSEQAMDYTDATATVEFNAAAGEEVTIAVEAAGSWVHFFVYVDQDTNGFTAAIAEGSDWQPAGDLVAYSFYNNDSSSDEFGWNSIGEEITGGDRNKPAIPAFKVPATEGKYRMRIKQDWSNIDPNGDIDGKFGDFKANGGQIVDVVLNVVADNGIEAVTTTQGAKAIYDLSGRRVLNPAKGVYIVNGKKVCVK